MKKPIWLFAEWGNEYYANLYLTGTKQEILDDLIRLSNELKKHLDASGITSPEKLPELEVRA